MRRLLLAGLTLVAAISLLGTPAGAAILTFDDAIQGATSYAFDGNADGIADAVFTTADPGGFRTVGPGSNMTYIQEPGLEGSSLVNDPASADLRVGFNFGAVGSLSFGFAVDSLSASPSSFAAIAVFDSGDNLIGVAQQAGAYTTTPSGRSSFPEGVITVSFSGLASYAILNFESVYGRYIIDNFDGTFGSGEPGTNPVPEPASMLLLGSGLVGLAFRRFRKH